MWSQSRSGHATATLPTSTIAVGGKWVESWRPAMLRWSSIASSTGKTKLAEAFVPLVQAAEQTLELSERKRARTLLRVDAGGGSLGDVNWALSRGYQFLGKDYSGQRARRLAQTVVTWIDDPKEPGRQVGWVEEPANEYVCEVKRLAIRKRKSNGQWAVVVLISMLTSEEVNELSHSVLGTPLDAQALLLALVSLYDQRGGRR